MLAWLSLVPVFILAGFATLILFRRDLHTVRIVSDIYNWGSVDEDFVYFSHPNCKQFIVGHCCRCGSSIVITWAQVGCVLATVADDVAAILVVITWAQVGCVLASAVDDLAAIHVY